MQEHRAAREWELWGALATPLLLSAGLALTGEELELVLGFIFGWG